MKLFYLEAIGFNSKHAFRKMKGYYYIVSIIMLLLLILFRNMLPRCLKNPYVH